MTQSDHLSIVEDMNTGSNAEASMTSAQLLERAFRACQQSVTLRAQSASTRESCETTVTNWSVR
ncbi:hypothetical protein [Sulfitobacter sp. S190]|uniref:hypothetical protein n=1 Tax=Sulfitobacter sp. S190 TaxID=2867022 RepID=UPI0021A5DDE0|nr:hypothetical protein [Sulfitobacter sp. S190]UWR24362.1 hypothetical protein K3756_17645 [Sulfitobacter sp. S190]